jgi:cytoskeletal protein RodZ
VISSGRAGAATRFFAAFLCLMISGITQPLVAQQTPAQQAPSGQQQEPSADQNTTVPPVELPESPGSSKSSTTPAATPQTTAPQQPPQPSGTAAAPAVQVSGGAASKPAGVAIAPPKQRQVRSWLIRFGFLAGAGAAIGTVVALSAASPGRVPNSGH